MGGGTRRLGDALEAVQVGVLTVGDREDADAALGSLVTELADQSVEIVSSGYSFRPSVITTIALIVCALAVSRTSSDAFRVTAYSGVPPDGMSC